MAVPVIDGYTDLVEVGRGGFGVVYRAHQPAFERTVAIKVITGTSTDDATMARFERECRAAGALSGHPNIVRVYGAGRTADGMPYLAMDYLSGGSVAARAPFTVSDTIALGVAVAGALETAHLAGIIHRDLKPENILYSGFGSPQLVDFGIARMRSAYETRSGTISATLTYAAPEVISGAPATPSSDVYSLACVLHFMLSGSPPFWVDGEESLAPLLARIATAPPPDLPEAPPALAALIASSLAKTMAERPVSAAAFGESLQAIARTLGETPPALPVPAAVVEAAASVVEGAQVTTAPVQGDRVALVPPIAAVGSVASMASVEEGEPEKAWRKPLLAAAAVVAIVGSAAAAAVYATSSSSSDDTVLTKGTPSPTASSLPAATLPPSKPTPTSSTTPAATPTTSTPPATTGTTGLAPATTTGNTTGGAPPAVTTGTTGGTTGGTPATTSPPPAKPVISKPTVPTSYRVDDVSAGSSSQTIRLAWSAPSSSGGQSPSYQITCQVIASDKVYSGSQQGGCSNGTRVFTAPAGSVAWDVTLSATVLPAASYVRWRIVAHNSAGDSGTVYARTTVPTLVGLDSSRAFAAARVASLNADGGTTTSCTGSPDVVCQQSIAAESSRSAGTGIALYFPAATASPTP